VVRTWTGNQMNMRATLVRLVPGAVAPVPVLAMPPGVNDFAVATAHLDAIRPAGQPSFGVSTLQVARIGLIAAQPAVVLAAIFGALWWSRRRPRLRPVPPAP
jgi:hypothetical protein